MRFNLKGCFILTETQHPPGTQCMLLLRPSLQPSISACEAVAVPFLQVVADFFLCCLSLFLCSSIFIISQCPLSQSTLPHAISYSNIALTAQSEPSAQRTSVFSLLFPSLEIPGLPFSLFECGHFSGSIALLRARQTHVILLPDP